MRRVVGRSMQRGGNRRLIAASVAALAGARLCLTGPGGGAGTPAAAWTASAPLGKKSTAKDVVDRLAPERRLQGRVALVTGGNSGIGLETVKALASAGCRVVLASRSAEGGRRAVEDEVRKSGLGGYAVPDADVEVKQLDLADLGSVVKFCEDVRASESRLDYLVLNAGVMALPALQRTADGFEMQIGVNHYGHALLTRLLRPVLEAQDFPSRVVTLSSNAHNMAKEFETDDLNFSAGEASEKKYSAWGAYGKSKLANALFAKALAKRLPADGRISSLSVHPGVIRTPLWRSTPAANPILGWLLDRLLVDKDVPQGAATTMWACLAEKASRPEYAGAYLADCAEGKLSALGEDEALAEALWEVTDKQLDEVLAKRGLGPDGKPLLVQNQEKELVSS